MIEQKCNPIAPKAPPHYELLSHPLVHHPDSPSFLSCLDILHNAAYLLDLFRHLDLDENSNHGGLSSEANEAFFWLAKMLEDTLSYVNRHLKEAWEKREAEPVQEKLQQSVFLKAMQEPIGSNKPYIYSIMASCLDISCTDVQAFVALIEGQQNNASNVQAGRA